MESRPQSANPGKSPRNLSRTLIFVLIALISVFAFFHFLLNSPQVQRYALGLINKHLNIQLHWDELRFNGATGHFRGKNLQLELQRSNISIGLNEFKLALDPIHLLFGKIHLYNLEAEGLSLDFKKEPESPRKKKSSSPEKIANLINMFNVDKALVSHIEVSTYNDHHLQIDNVSLKKEIPFLLYKRAVSLQMRQARYRSPKLDLFGSGLSINGSFNVKYDDEIKQLAPTFDGRVQASDFLIGFFKKPNPQNTSLPWDEALSPVIKTHYGDNLPDNRTFLFVSRLQLNTKIQPESYQLRPSVIQLAGGIVEVSGLFNKDRETLRFSLDTTKPIQVPLLPLGKARVRTAFESVGLHLQARGRLKDLNEGNVVGSLKAELEPLELEPDKPTILISANPVFKNGLVQVPDLRVQIGEGKILGKGNVNLVKKEFHTDVTGNKIYIPSILHIFSSLDIPGQADVNGTIGGAFTNPDFNLDLSSESFGYESLHFGSFHGKLRIAEQKLTIQGGSLLEGKGAGSIDLTINEVFKTALQTIFLKTKFNELPAGPLLETQNLTGNVDGFFNLSKTQNHYDGDGQIIVKDATLSGIPIEQAMADLKVRDKVLTLQPIHFTWNSSAPAEVITKPFVFKFDDEGYHFEGNVLNTATAQGLFRKSQPDHILIDLKAQNTPLDFLSPLIPFETDRILLSGDFKIDYRTKSPIDSFIQGRITSFGFSGEEKNINLAHGGTIELKDRHLQFGNVALKFGRGELSLNGPLSFVDEASDLKIKGQVDLDQLMGIHPFIVEGAGMAAVDVNLKGSANSPSFFGNIRFDGDALFLRPLGRELSQLNGTVELSGKRYQFSHLTGLYDDAPFTLNGWFEWEAPDKLIAADLSLQGKEIPITSPESWRLLTDANVRLQGTGESLTLSGGLQIVEGLYYKDYSLSEYVLKPIGVSIQLDRDALPDVIKAIRLNLNVQSAGDFLIKNNLANINLSGELQLRGTIEVPDVVGAINITEGEIFALGLIFKDASGFINFTQAAPLNPYIEFTASYDIQDYEVRARINGFSSNLALSFESTPALNHNDIVSLIAYGRTPDQLSDNARDLFSRAAVASQLISVLQRPITQATTLDIIRLETDYDRNDSAVSRFYIGKQLSDRFSLAFTTDLTFDEAYKGVAIEYRLLDGLLLKGTKDTGSRYRFDITWRLQAY